MALDGDSDGIKATGPADPGHSVGGDPPGLNRGQGIRAIPRVVLQIRIDKYPGGRIRFGPVGSHHCFPAHIGSKADVLREGTLANGRVAGIHHDIGIHVRQGAGLEVKEVDPEVDFSVRGAPVPERKSHNIAR